jgi:hypothetical protein
MMTIYSLSPPAQRRLQAALLIAYVLIASGLLFSQFTNAGYDDPFITYRYAQNLAQGRGFVYNPGQRTLSTTTPLFTLLLALLTPLPVDMPTQAIVIGCVSLALGGVLLWDLARTWRAPAVGWAGLLLYPTFSRLVSTLGSETPLYNVFCLGAFALYARKRYNWSAACCALAVLTRPDGVLVPLVLAAGYLWEQRRSLSLKVFPWRAGLIFAGLLAPWILFAWLYFGSPLPVTLAAKQSQGTMTIFQSFFDGFVTILANHARFPQYWVEAALAGIGLLWLVSRGRSWILLLAWTTLYFSAYTFLGVSRYFWYYGPLLPGFIALVGLGAEAIRTLGLPADQPEARAVRGGQASRPLLILLALLLLAQLADLNRLSHSPDIRLGLYRVAGDWLRDNTPPDASVGTLEVGILGYYSGRQMIDFAGLIQPQVVSQLTNQVNFENAAIWATNNYRPDYLLLHRGYLPDLESGYAARRCRLIISFSSSYLVLDLYGCAQ